MNIRAAGFLGPQGNLLGAIHSTKLSELRFENFLGSNGSRRVRTVSFHSPRKKSFALFFKMADLGLLLLMLESKDDNFDNTDIVEDDDDIIMLSGVSCFVHRKLPIACTCLTF